MKLELYYPAKPFYVTQDWGVYNTAYTQFGFDHHNGVDFELEPDSLLHAPQRLLVTEVGYVPNGAGNFVRFILTDKWEVLGTECWVGGIVMHMKEQQVKVGQICEIGEVLGIADNTGFSTGPHTHLSLYRLKNNLIRPENTVDNILDTDSHYGHTFNPALFFNGKYAVDNLPASDLTPEDEKLVESGIAVAKEAIKNPSLRGGLQSFLQSLSDYLKGLHK